MCKFWTGEERIHARRRIIAGAGAASVLVALVLTVFTLVFPATAAPGAQGDLPATPTLAPITGTAYTLETVGGEALTQTVSYTDQEGFTFGEGTVFSDYPQGLIFTLAAEK